MASEKITAFILFNGREQSVERINNFIAEQGISTYFWERDIGIGRTWTDVEDRNLEEALVILVFLGDAGWEPTHLELTLKAQKLNKDIFPILIGNPPEKDYFQANALFHDRRYIDLREPTEEALMQLVVNIRTLTPEQRPAGEENIAQFDTLIRTLTDGEEIDRTEALKNIRFSKTINRPALSRRLRNEIQDHYGSRNETQFASSERNPKLMASIRSWMLSCLIWTDKEDPANRKVILDHLDQVIEPDEITRYWTLAGIYQSQASYMDVAVDLALKDDAKVVAALALAVRTPGEFADRFRSNLASDDFETVWLVLRVLRIVPVMVLVQDLCSLLTKSFSNEFVYYDLFYALCNQPIAREAAPILANAPGMQETVVRMINILRRSNPNAVRNFAGLLIFFDAKALDQVFKSVLGIPEYKDISVQLQSELAYYRHESQGKDLYVAGYRPDLNTVDKLDIIEDVQTITAVMLATEVPPPLAIALFGDWGTGKSFFMSTMREVAARLSKEDKDNPKPQFCTDIVQITFNAWHYTDTNLWASLVSYILEQLAVYVSPNKNPEEQKADFLSELSSTKAVINETKLDGEQTRKVIEDRQQELLDLRSKREQKQIHLSDLKLADIKSMFDPKESKELNDSLNALGVPAAFKSLKDLEEVVDESYTIRGRVASVFFSIVNAKNRWTIVVLLLLTLGLIPALIWLLHTYWHKSLLTGFAAFLSEFVAVAAGFVAIVRKGIAQANKGLRVVEDARDRINRALDEKKKAPGEQEIRLMKEIAELTAREAETASRLSAATSRMTEIEKKIQSLNEERSLNRFLADRTLSDDYRKHLGLISIIRRDFERLSESLSVPAAPGAKAFKRVDRIILYIDDLDRCPPEKVLEVLHAVHLLLAYPLFVVVVAVDPRWLFHSLGKTYTPFQSADDTHADDDLWKTTPQNFLEKIFQISFSLRPMNAEGYNTLISDLFSTPKIESAETEAKDTKAIKDNVPQNGGAQINIPAGGQATGAGQPPPAALIPDSPKAGATLPNADSQIPTPQQDKSQEYFISRESLTIRPWETLFGTTLFSFMPNPRAAKRFTNIYRILKAGVHRNDLARFEGVAGMPGEFQVPMFLLAILVGAPAEATLLFPALQKSLDKDQDIMTALSSIKRLAPALRKYGDFQEKIQLIIDNGTFPFTVELFNHWLPKLSRFSFDLGKIMYSFGAKQK